MPVDELPPGQGAAPLSAGDLLRAGFAALSERPMRDLLAIAGLWTVIIALVDVYVQSATPAPPVSGEVTGEPASGAGMAGLLAMLVSLAAFIDVGVKWIRCLVLDEMPRSFLDPRLNRRRWSFLLRSLLLGLPLVVVVAIVSVVIIAVVVGTGSGGVSAGVVTLPLVLLLMFALSYFMGGRFGLYLVGAALGDPRMTLAASWDTTRESGMAITLAVLGASLAFFVPSYLVIEIAHLLGSVFGATAAAILFALPLAALNIAAYLVYEAILARAYGRLVPEPPAGTLVD